MSASVRFLKKALLAAELGIQAWRPMSTGEKVSVALASNRQDWLLDMGYSIPEDIGGAIASLLDAENAWVIAQRIEISALN